MWRENAFYLIQYISYAGELCTRNPVFCLLSSLGNLFRNLCDSRDQPSSFGAIHESGLRLPQMCTAQLVTCVLTSTSIHSNSHFPWCPLPFDDVCSYLKGLLAFQWCQKEATGRRFFYFRLLHTSLFVSYFLLLVFFQTLPCRRCSRVRCTVFPIKQTQSNFSSSSGRQLKLIVLKTMGLWHISKANRGHRKLRKTFKKRLSLLAFPLTWTF